MGRAPALCGGGVGEEVVGEEGAESREVEDGVVKGGRGGRAGSRRDATRVCTRGGSVGSVI